MTLQNRSADDTEELADHIRALHEQIWLKIEARNAKYKASAHWHYRNTVYKAWPSDGIFGQIKVSNGNL